MSKLAKKLADGLFTEHYSVLFDSESDKGQEILISILAIKSAIKSCEFALKFASKMSIKCTMKNYFTDYELVEKIIIELKKL